MTQIGSYALSLSLLVQFLGALWSTLFVMLILILYDYIDIAKLSTLLIDHRELPLAACTLHFTLLSHFMEQAKLDLAGYYLSSAYLYSARLECTTRNSTELFHQSSVFIVFSTRTAECTATNRNVFEMAECKILISHQIQSYLKHRKFLWTICVQRNDSTLTECNVWKIDNILNFLCFEGFTPIN